MPKIERGVLGEIVGSDETYVVHQVNDDKITVHDFMWTEEKTIDVRDFTPIENPK